MNVHVPGLCKVKASLEGDFAAFSSAPHYESKYLFRPVQCEYLPDCAQRVWVRVESGLDGPWFVSTHTCSPAEPHATMLSRTNRLAGC